MSTPHPRPLAGPAGRRPARVLLSAALAFVLPAAGPALAQVVPYNPYADSQDPTPPVLPDGTIHWGTFYKSAAIQKAYERLWNLGACRNSNKAITIPVENNRLAIDTLPEGEFRGLVKAVVGGNSGGMLAFVQPNPQGQGTLERVALLHPAGVSRVEVAGEAAAAFLVPGMTVRFQATVDARGRSAAPVGRFHVVAPASEAKPTPVVAGGEELVVGRVVAIRRGVLTVRVDAGTIRRLTIPLAPDTVVEVHSSQIALASPGDTVEIEGRLWGGEGALGDGSVFADRIRVTKRLERRGEAAAPEVDDVGAR